MTQNRKRLLTEEQHAFLVANAKGVKRSDMLNLINEKFGLNLKLTQLVAYYKNRGITNGLDMTFKEGGVPVNKGVKGVYNIGGNASSFKPGHTPARYMPIGSESISKDGYFMLKVSDEGAYNKRWQLKHKVMWEKVNGPVPKGHALLFADGNRLNCTLDNLILVTRGQLAVMVKRGLIQDNKESTQSGVLISDILLKINDRKRGKRT